MSNYNIPDDTHVLIATPNYTNLICSEAHVNHIECVTKWTKWGIKFNWTMIGRTFVHFARTQACQAAVAGGFTHIFWVDDDAIIDPEILPRYINHDVDVVISPYPMRRSPFQIGVLSAQSYRNVNDVTDVITIPDNITPPDFYKHDNGNMYKRDFHEHPSYRNFNTSDMDKGLVSVDGGGTHAMLVKVSALTECRGLAPPSIGDKQINWSYAPELILTLDGLTAEQKTAIDHHLGDLPDQSMTMKEEDDQGRSYFTMPKTGTEDMLWCYKAKCKGVGIYCDTDTFSSHVGFAPTITRGFTEQAEKLKQKPKSEQGTVQLTPIVSGRNHTGIKKDSVGSLV